MIHIGPTCWFEVLAIEEVAWAERDEKTEKDKKSWWSPHLHLWADWRVRSEDVKIVKGSHAFWNVIFAELQHLTPAHTTGLRLSLLNKFELGGNWVSLVGIGRLDRNPGGLYWIWRPLHHFNGDPCLLNRNSDVDTILVCLIVNNHILSGKLNLYTHCVTKAVLTHVAMYPDFFSWKPPTSALYTNVG